MKGELIKASGEIAVYDEFRSQISEIKEANSKLVFNYSTPKGEKEARSHIFTLRKTKTAIDKARAAEKKSSLDYGRLVDSQAKTLISEVEDMIKIHQDPLDEIAQKEEARINAIKARMEAIDVYFTVTSADGAESISNSIEALTHTIIDASFQELQGDAMVIHKNALDHLNCELIEAQRIEHDRAELAKLKAEQAEREQKEREERIAREASEKAEREKAEAIEREQAAIAAQAKAEQDAIEYKARAEQQAIEAKARAEEQAKQAELNRIAAEAKAKQDAIDAQKRADENARIAAENARLAEVKRQEEQARLEREEAARKAADLEHVKAINNEALTALIQVLDCSEEMAKSIIIAIAKKQIDHVSITY